MYSAVTMESRLVQNSCKVALFPTKSVFYPLSHRRDRLSKGTLKSKNSEGGFSPSGDPSIPVKAPASRGLWPTWAAAGATALQPSVKLTESAAGPPQLGWPGKKKKPESSLVPQGSQVQELGKAGGPLLSGVHPFLALA